MRYVSLHISQEVETNKQQSTRAPAKFKCRGTIAFFFVFSCTGLRQHSITSKGGFQPSFIYSPKVFDAS